MREVVRFGGKRLYRPVANVQDAQALLLLAPETKNDPRPIRRKTGKATVVRSLYECMQFRSIGAHHHYPRRLCLMLEERAESEGNRLFIRRPRGTQGSAAFVFEYPPGIAA